jgi:hypothetical protein
MAQAVQKLPRLNRLHPLKEDTFGLDFLNDRDEICEAFKPNYEDAVPCASVFSLARGTPPAGRGHRLSDGGAGRKGRLEFLSGQSKQRFG